MIKIETPPLPLPLKGGESLRSYCGEQGGSSSPPIEGRGRGGVCNFMSYIPEPIGLCIFQSSRVYYQRLLHSWFITSLCVISYIISQIRVRRGDGYKRRRDFFMGGRLFEKGRRLFGDFCTDFLPNSMPSGRWEGEKMLQAQLLESEGWPQSSKSHQSAINPDTSMRTEEISVRFSVDLRFQDLSGAKANPQKQPFTATPWTAMS